MDMVIGVPGAEREAPDLGQAWRTSITFVIMSAVLAIGTFVPLLVDFLRSGGVSWSLYVLGATTMTWLIAMPWFVVGRHRALLSWGMAVLTVPLYLVLVSVLTQGSHWLVPLGLPSAALGLLALGALVWLWSASDASRWQATALTFAILGLLSLAEDAVARPFAPPGPHEAINALVTLALLSVSMVLGVAAFWNDLRRGE